MAIRRDELDVVLMDLQMPVMGGLEATRKIRGGEQGTGRHIPIVAMTASGTQDQKRARKQAWTASSASRYGPIYCEMKLNG